MEMEKHKKYLITGIIICTALFIAFSLFGSKLIKADSTTPPSVRILSYSHTDFVSDRLYFDIYDNSGSGLAGVKLFADGAYVMDIGSPYDMATYDTSALADGTYQLEAVATDAAGNVATSSPYAMTIDHAPPPPPLDTTAPNVTILSIVDNKIYTDIYDIGGSEIASVQLYIDDVLSQTITPPAPFDLITVDTSTLAVGEHEVFVSAVDVAGNWATSSANQLTVVDSTAPETTDNVPAGSQTRSAEITFICTDGISGCQKTFYTIDGTDPDVASNFVNSSSSWQFIIRSIGSYVVKYRSIDNADNLEAVKTAANTLVIVRASSGGSGGEPYIPPATTTEAEIATTTVTEAAIETTTPIISTEVVIEVPAASLIETQDVEMIVEVPAPDLPAKKIKKALKAVVTPPAVTPDIPVIGVVADAGVKLFDIVLSLQNALLGRSRDLISRLEFTSFGNVPTMVNLVYRIIDADNHEVYNETDEVIVETEQVVTRNFGNLNLADGKYTLIVTTVYSDNITDEFRQTFVIKGASMLGYQEMVRLLASLISLIIVGLIAFGLFKYVRQKKKIN